MGCISSCCRHECHHHCHRRACFVKIDDNDVRQFWSYNSRSSKGCYVYRTDESTGGGSYIVAAKGDATVATKHLTDITFEEVVSPDPSKFNQVFALKFKSGTQNDTWYYIHATLEHVIASASGSGSAPTPFHVEHLYQPNEAFFVLRSVHKKESEDWYLSSDGSGTMKLKPWNKPAPNPPDTSAEVDPAFLFRMVMPLKATHIVPRPIAC